jgi:hypothetical protein
MTGLSRPRSQPSRIEVSVPSDIVVSGCAIV